MKKLLNYLRIGTVLMGALAIPAFALAVETDPALYDVASEKAPTTFATADETVAAFKAAVTAGDAAKVGELLGLDPVKAKATDGAAETFAAIREGVKRSLTSKEEKGIVTVFIGDRQWPFPFPISKKEDGKWSFDTYAGLDEIIARRVGENELMAIQTMGSYVDAQYQYAQTDHDNDGLLEYAQKLMSTEGERDGLFWESDFEDANDESPGGPGLVDAEFNKAKAGEGFFGYHYRILTGQGANIAGGKFDYIINGNMVAGFGLVAWPAKYGETGIKTFVVSKEGVIYQADLGDKTATIAADIRTFNPGDSWSVVKEDEEDGQ